MSISTLSIFGQNQPLELQTKKGRIYKNYLKTSYELSNYDEWFSSDNIYSDGLKYTYGNPLSEMQFCQLDIDGDGLEDLFYYKWYDLNINPTPNPPPEIFMNNGKSLNRVNWDGPNIKYPHGVKLLVGDFNNDSIPDIFSLVAIDPPYEVGFPKLQDNCHLLFNSPTGFKTVKEFDDQLGFWGAGASGDIDNDRDLDIVMFNFHVQANGVKNKILWNDGKGNFTYDTTGIGEIPVVEQAELFDINNDGFLDLILDYITSEPERTPHFTIMWGNGKNFNFDNSTSFLLNGDKFLMDYDFADLDNDGISEIIISGIDMTLQTPTYYVDIFKSNDSGKSFTDKTAQLIDNNTCLRFSHMILKDIDKNGRLDIYAADKKDNIRWEWNGFKFIKITPTGIESNELNKSIVVKPNPSDGKFKIEGLPVNQKNNIIVYTIDGRLIRKQICNTDNETIDLRDQISGVYLLFVNNQVFKILKE